eukprot:9572331-Alexandrium_andersonii.AAC.1
MTPASWEARVAGMASGHRCTGGQVQYDQPSAAHPKAFPQPWATKGWERARGELEEQRGGEGRGERSGGSWTCQGPRRPCTAPSEAMR